MNTPIPSLRPLSDIPNQSGFMLELIRLDGSKQLARVAVEPLTGCHYCATPNGRKVDLTGESDERSPCIGWVPYVPPVVFPIPGCVAKGNPHLMTRSQLEKLLSISHLSEPPPAKGKALFIIDLPGQPLPVCRIVVSESKSTDGKTLFACQYYAKE